MSNPNNFPREGQHTIVTAAALKKLERERPVRNAERHFTIGGDVETVVHSNLNSEREAAITNGVRRLAQASQQIHHGFDVARPDARTEYIRAQREAARNHPARNVTHLKGPAR